MNGVETGESRAGRKMNIWTTIGIGGEYRDLFAFFKMAAGRNSESWSKSSSRSFFARIVHYMEMQNFIKLNEIYFVPKWRSSF